MILQQRSRSSMLCLMPAMLGLGVRSARGWQLLHHTWGSMSVCVRVMPVWQVVAQCCPCSASGVELLILTPTHMQFVCTPNTHVVSVGISGVCRRWCKATHWQCCSLRCMMVPCGWVSCLLTSQHVLPVLCTAWLLSLRFLLGCRRGRLPLMIRRC